MEEMGRQKLTPGFRNWLAYSNSWRPINGRCSFGILCLTLSRRSPSLLQEIALCRLPGKGALSLLPSTKLHLAFAVDPYRARRVFFVRGAYTFAIVGERAWPISAFPCTEENLMASTLAFF